ncbi:ABC transporter substrate-binding protein [Brevibacillus dissolubilis]|uniref:ABC transporter substrate-binding protein n=1 Tax=Brevibacillus dissolubilis TaxID=1844116 RepID=UPI0021000963|nr:extracellular solute-binding protein [Brevibacillus dissolubilis]
MITKKWAATGMSLVMAASLTACSTAPTSNSGTGSGQTATTEGGKEVIELKMGQFGSTGYEKLAEEYMKDHPNVKIQISTSDFNDHHNNLFTAISAGSGAPDIAMVEVGFIEKYRGAQDRFVNLYEMGAKDLQSNYLDWKWSVGESADHSFLFGLPTDIGPTVMYYRTDIFEAAGLPSDPEKVAEQIKTWDDFANAARTIKEKTGKPMTDNVELIYNALRDQAPEMYFDRANNLIVEKNPAMKKAYDYTAKLIQDGVLGNLALWTPEWGAAMADGGYATLLGASWMQGNIKGNAPDAKGKWAITQMPEGAGNWGGSYLVITKESKHPKEAYEFIKWITSPDNQYKSFLDQGLFPSATAVYDESKFKDYTDEYFGGQHTAQIMSEAAKKVKNVYYGENFSIVQGEILKALQNVQSKKSDPEQEWSEAIARVKQQLERK